MTLWTLPNFLWFGKSAAWYWDFFWATAFFSDVIIGRRSFVPASSYIDTISIHDINNLTTRMCLPSWHCVHTTTISEPTIKLHHSELVLVFISWDIAYLVTLRYHHPKVSTNYAQHVFNDCWIGCVRKDSKFHTAGARVIGWNTKLPQEYDLDFSYV